MRRLILFPFLLSLISFNFYSSQTSQVNASKEDISSVEFVKNLGVGYNLGNTLNGDAKQLTDNEFIQSIYKPLGFDDFEMFMEARDLPSNRRGKINENMVNEIYNKGFRSIRLPISWSNHMEDGVISIKWINRIQEVTDMFLAKEGVSVILTLMESPLAYTYGDKSYNLSDAYFVQSEKLISDVWTQVGNKFKDYGQNLIFENLNEPQYDHNHRWNFYFTSNGMHDADLYKEANENLMALNQKFVDVVRSTGGNNLNRFLTINTIGNTPEFAYDIRANSISQFKMPNDISKDKLIFNAHAYCPSNFTYFNVKSGRNEDVWTDKSSIDSLCNNLKTNFIDKGIGTIISEWGSVEDTTNPNRHASRVAHAKYYMEKATLANIAMYVWDGACMNNNEGGEGFGFLNRFTANGSYVFDTLAGTKMDVTRVWYHNDVIQGIFDGYNDAKQSIDPSKEIFYSFSFIGEGCSLNNLETYKENTEISLVLVANEGYSLPKKIEVIGTSSYFYSAFSGTIKLVVKNDIIIKAYANKNNDVEPSKDEENKKKGCEGSIVASSLIITTLSFFGVCLLISKKEYN